MSSAQEQVDLVVRTIAQTAVDNEKHFGDLDSVAGDGDLGYSLARGFEKLLQGFDDLDRSDVGTFLKKVGVTITSRIGGTSGPIWGTGFMRAGAAAGDVGSDGGDTVLDGGRVVAMLRAATDGIKERGRSDVGDKTLLDVLVPMTDRIEAEVAAGTPAPEIVANAATTAREAAEATASLQARRGRASYTGERSIGSVDAGGMAVAVIVEQIAGAWNSENTQRSEGAS